MQSSHLVVNQVSTHAMARAAIQLADALGRARGRSAVRSRCRQQFLEPLERLHPALLVQRLPCLGGEHALA
jgi:hypothetical protein